MLACRPVVVLDDPSGATSAPEPLLAAFVHEERLADAPVPEATPVVALTADPLGRASGTSAGRRISRIVPSMGDEFDAGTDPPGDAVTTGAETATMDQLLELAALAARAGLGDTDRVLSGRWLLSPAGAATGLLAPPACGAGVVLVNNRPGPVLEAGRRRAGHGGRAPRPPPAAGPPPAGLDPRAADAAR